VRCLIYFSGYAISVWFERVIRYVSRHVACRLFGMACSSHRDICRTFSTYTTACSTPPSSHTEHWFRTGVEINRLPAADQYYEYWGYDNPNHKTVEEGGHGLPMDVDSNL
jgi:hypothetical protein